MKSCANCVFNLPTGCAKGDEGFEYCTSGDYEMWAPLSEEKREEIAKEVAAARDNELMDSGIDDDVVEAPEDAEELGDDSDSDEVSPSPASSKEALIQMAKAMGASDEDAEKMAATQEKLANEQTFDGYNGKEKKAGVVLSSSCQGCRNHHELTGCFLNKYTECTNNGRFMYVPVKGDAVPLEGEELEKYNASQKAEGHIDGLIHSENSEAAAEAESMIDDLLDRL